jgi:hypothetical protein
MTTDAASSLNKLFMRIARRADMRDPDVLARTFVRVQQVSEALELIDHQILYGRRGTGKTHAFFHLADTVTREGDLAVYIDLRQIGSGGTYTDGKQNQNLTIRGTQLLIDVMEALHEQLLNRAIEDDQWDALLPVLDHLAEASTEIRVEGPVEEEEERQVGSIDAEEDSGGLDVGPGAGITVKGRAGRKSRRESSTKAQLRVRRAGEALPRVYFGPLGRALNEIADALAPRRLWILLDEWSSLPYELQPLLADLFRRTLFPSRGLTVKIGAVERRSNFMVRRDQGTYLGIELGADAAASLDLDEYLLATEGGPLAREFFAELLYKHVSVLLTDLGYKLSIQSAEEMIGAAFEPYAFQELVRAAEGVPRDGLNVVLLAAGRAGSPRISVEDVQSSARRYYLRDKEDGIKGNRAAEDMWIRLQREVVANRRQRTFLLRRTRESANAAIQDLYDARLIHLLRPGLATATRPGVLYDGYSLDYGCYVHLFHEAEIAAAWEARRRPWEFKRGIVLLPDRFDENAIFTATKPRSGKKRAMAIRPEGV